MFKSASIRLDLDALDLGVLMERLSRDPRIVGVVLFGSAGEDRFNDSSDYDLAVVAHLSGIPISGLLTLVAGRLCDVILIEAADVYKWVTTGELPAGDYWQQGLRRWAVEGTILFERNELLTQVRKLSEPLSWFTSLTEAQIHAMWFSGYYRLKQLRRHLEKDDEVVHTYLDLRFGFFIHQIVQFYFAVRDYPWTGTRRALEWLKVSDPKFFGLVNSSLGETDRRLKWVHCSALLEEVMRPVGDWPDEVTGITFSRGATVSEETVAAAADLVTELFGGKKPGMDERL